MARIRAMTRSTFGMAKYILAVADLEMDCNAHTVARGGEQIVLSAKEYALLEYLMRNQESFSPVRRSRTISGTLIMKEARMWSMFISVICAKSWTTGMRKS